MKQFSLAILLAALLQSGRILVVPAFALAASSAPDWSATQTAAPAKGSDWFAGMKAALKAAQAGRQKEALAIVQSVDRLGNVPPDFVVEVHAAIVDYAIAAKDYATAAAMNDQMLTQKEGNRYDELEDCALVAMLQNRIDRARECARLFDAR